MKKTIGVLALQGAFAEHIFLLEKACRLVQSEDVWEFLEVRTNCELIRCSGLIIPGGESTTVALIASKSNLLESLRDFVHVQKKPTWGTCAGLILLAEEIDQAKKGGQANIGGLAIRVRRNYFGRQLESFQTLLTLSILPERFPAIFIRAPVVVEILSESVKVVARVPVTDTSVQREVIDSGNIVAVQQGNIFGTSFHPELTDNPSIHAWWLRQFFNN